MFLHRLGKIKAPEFPKGLDWVGGQQLTMKSLTGKVILIDFWTYSCINCIRTIPHLKDFYKKYKQNGLVVIGVHTPEFTFEKDAENVRRAVKEFGIDYPIVLDPDYKVWNAYANRWWPRSFVVDRKGNIVYDHIGEGGYFETEAAIQGALLQGNQIDLPSISPDNLVGGGICYRTTPEVYLGFLRGRYGNAMDLVPNQEHAFTDDGEHEEDLVYLHGHWRITAESVDHARNISGQADYLGIKYNAFSVNVVAGSLTSKAARAVVELDGRPLLSDMAGKDILIEDGISYLLVKDARMYEVVKSDAYQKGVLKIKTGADNLSIFAITFGGCR
ncbi:redoxin family protein [Patescibacteria group bacterium]|nr:redoxin family protein [Patescibacteria group bacterium]